MRSAFGIALGVALSLGLASTSRAAFTAYNPPPSGEDSFQQILSHVYGGAFSAAGIDNRDFTNGTITATRVEDTYSPSLDGPNPPSPLSGTQFVGNDDQIWNGTFQLATAEAVFASFDQEFGYYAGSSGGTYVNLFDVTNKGYAVQGSADLDNIDVSTLRWARGGEGRVVSSLDSDNADGLDHMLTYRIDGLGNGKLTWLVLWEDKFECELGADFDYNDLAVQITACPASSAPVPEPGSASLMLCGIAASALRFRGRRISH